METYTALNDKKRHDELVKKATDDDGIYYSSRLSDEEIEELNNIYNRNLNRAANGIYNF